MSEELKRIGAQMANVIFNLAQLPGERITYQQAEAFDSLRRQWDAAVRAASAERLQAQGEELQADEAETPPLPDHPEPRVMQWSELEKRAIRAYGQECARAEFQHNVARIQHLTHERDQAHADCRAALSGVVLTPEMKAAGIERYDFAMQIGMPEYSPDDAIEMAWDAMIEVALAANKAKKESK